MISPERLKQRRRRKTKTKRQIRNIQEHYQIIALPLLSCLTKTKDARRSLSWHWWKKLEGSPFVAFTQVCVQFKIFTLFSLNQVLAAGMGWYWLIGLRLHEDVLLVKHNRNSCGNNFRAAAEGCCLSFSLSPCTVSRLIERYQFKYAETVGDKNGTQVYVLLLYKNKWASSSRSKGRNQNKSKSMKVKMTWFMSNFRNKKEMSLCDVVFLR